MTPRWCNCAGHNVTAARLYFDSLPGTPKSWGQLDPNPDDYHFHPREISSTWWLPDITDWWSQQEEMHSKYAGLSDKARNIISIIPHGVRVEATFSIGWGVTGWRQSEATAKMHQEKCVVRQFAVANNGTLAGDFTGLDTTATENNLELKREVEERKLPWLAKIHDILEMCQGSQNLLATQKEFRARNKQITAVGYISDIEDIVQSCWSLFQHDGAAAFTLWERSPLPQALSAQDLPGGQTQVLNFRQISIIDCHPAEGDEDCAPESISDTEQCLNWDGDLDNPIASEHDW